MCIGEKLRLCGTANSETSLIKKSRVILIQITTFALAKQHALNRHFKVLFYFALKLEMKMIVSLLFSCC